MKRGSNVVGALALVVAVFVLVWFPLRLWWRKR